MKKLFTFLLWSLLFTAISFAETAVVKRNVTLRPDPSTNNEAVITFSPGQRLTLISLRKRNGYLHVTVGQQKGWVWARNVDIDESSDNGTEEHSTDVKTAKENREDNDFCTEGNIAGVQHIGPAELYPDPNKTPGVLRQSTSMI